MKIYCLIGCFLLGAGFVWGQIRPLRPYSGSELTYLSGSPKPFLLGRWRPDQQTYFKYTNPRLTISPVSANGYSNWLGSTTTQSFNNGKFGTIYYYDMMGNMQYARTFIDIAGKNKRGLKLMLPTLNQRMFMQR